MRERYTKVKCGVRHNITIDTAAPESRSIIGLDDDRVRSKLELPQYLLLSSSLKARHNAPFDNGFLAELEELEVEFSSFLSTRH